MRRLVFAAVLGCALTAHAQDPALTPAPQAPACLPGRDCAQQTLPPKERKTNTAKKQCGWATVNGKKEPLFDCGGAK